MSKPNTTTGQLAQCLRILEAAADPLVAADIARQMQLSGSRESQRRHVRAIIKKLRDDGSMVVAALQGGYWLTDDKSIWCQYLDGRQIDAKVILGETHKKKKEILQDATGQELLFDNRIPCGCATMAIA